VSPIYGVETAIRKLIVTMCAIEGDTGKMRENSEAIMDKNNTYPYNFAGHIPYAYLFYFNYFRAFRVRYAIATTLTITSKPPIGPERIIINGSETVFAITNINIDTKVLRHVIPVIVV